jgi:hypothetical protein
MIAVSLENILYQCDDPPVHPMRSLHKTTAAICMATAVKAGVWPLGLKSIDL